QMRRLLPISTLFPYTTLFRSRDLLAALKHDGTRWLEELLNDPALSYKGNQPQPDEENFGQRPKAILLMLGWITLRRAYLYSAERSEEHTSELQSRFDIVCRLL